MHFAGFYGLGTTAEFLLEHWDGAEQAKVENDAEQTPADLALSRGHAPLAHLLSSTPPAEEAPGRLGLKYCRESVLSLSQQAIVSKNKNRLKGLNERKEKTELSSSFPCYENLPETEITETAEEGEAEDHGGSVCGSYVTFTEEDKVHDKVEDKVEEKVKKPTPIARTPRAHATTEYTNIEVVTKSLKSPSSEEVVLRRDAKNKEKLSRDPARRKSISPLPLNATSSQDYDVPRLANQDYEIPPPGPRPVVAELPGPNSNEPILVKKGTGSIPTTNDGYIFMDDEGEGAGPQFQEHIKYHDGAFIAVIEEKTLGVKSYKKGDKGFLQRVDSAPEHGVEKSEKARKTSQVSGSGHTPSQAVVLDSVDEELIQLMRDFASSGSGYSMQQIELLFENWKGRPDVLQSIETKELYLKQLREEYKRTQAHNNDTKGGILDKIRVAFKGNN